MRKIAVVTGATSLIGANLLPLLCEAGYTVYAAVRRGSQKPLPQDAKIVRVECDLSETDSLAERIGRADVFFHLAWNGTRGADRSDEALQQANYEASLAALEAAKKLGCACFVGAGSQAEYGVCSEEITEETVPAPNTAYGRAKLAFTREGGARAQAAGMRFVMPRFFSLYGKGDYPNTILQSLVTKLLRGEDCPLTACTQFWNFMYIADAVRAMLYLAEGGFSGVYNFATEDTRPLRSFVEEVRAAIGGQGKLLFGALAYPASGAVSMRPRIDKLLATGFCPAWPFARGIAAVIAYEQQRKEKP